MNRQFITLIISLLGLTAFGQDKGDRLPSTIENNQINIDTASFYSVFKQLNFDSASIVVIGEAHTIKNTLGTEFFIIKNLAEKGYKTIYREGGVSEAAIINRYMETGDSSLLNYTRARESTGSNKKFLQSLYQINSKNNYRLEFKGFDFERPLCVGYLFSKWFGNIKIGHIDFKKINDYIISIDAQQSKDLKAVRLKSLKLKVVIDSIKTSFTENENRYKEILKENYSTFLKIVFNPIYADFKNRGDFYTNRDPYFTKTLLQIDKEAGGSKSIIIVGNGHVLNKNKFIPMLADSLPEKYSIIGFIFIYSRCENFDSNIKYSSRKEFLKYLNKRDSNKPLVDFAKSEQQIIPSGRKNISNIVTGIYNQ